MSVVRHEVLSAEKAEAYRGTFAPDDAPVAVGEPLHPAWEGVYFGFDAAFADLRPDGTPARDGVLPEIDLPRRMYAGEDTEFLRSLRVGDRVEQTARLGAVSEKNGSSGRLVFADIVREYAVDGEVAVRTTWHDVFLGEPDPSAAVREPRRDADAATSAHWRDDLTLDARQLFRFSALTFNTHLVHYDRTWAREVEGLSDLLVHGPLTRIVLMDAARRHTPDRSARALQLRSVAPIFVNQPVRIVGSNDGDLTHVTALGQDDTVLATAQITWS